MVFSSVFFIFIFLPVVFIIYYLTPKFLKNILLLFCSLLFYAWGEPVYVFLMGFSILFNYTMGLDLSLNEDNFRRRKRNFIFAVTVNLFILVFFKYHGSPIGLSFFTFQTLSYLADIYMKKANVQKNLIDFGLYVSLFPQLVAGPIIKYSDIAEQLKDRKHSITKIGCGSYYFIRGLFKKVILANSMSTLFQALTEEQSSTLSVLSAWLALIAFSFQIYFDFSGYSDMASGLGKLFGFDFPKNFNFPYFSFSITDFWRKWHISLSSWFREYVYIPLGGNKAGSCKTIRNILVIWILTGFWHGASWNFIIWGVYYAVLLIIEKFLLKGFINKLPALFKILYTIFLVMLGWVFFFCSSLPEALHFFPLLFGRSGNLIWDDTGIYFLVTNLILLLLCLLSSTPFFHRLLIRLTASSNQIGWKITAVIHSLLFLLCIAYLLSESYQPFLYFRF